MDIVVAKPKKRYSLRVVLFITIFLVLFISLMWLFSKHPDHRIYQMIGGFYEEPENSLDGVYIGSSNCYAFWNPLVAWENYGIAVYPYASGSQPFYAAEYLIREGRKTQPDALYIVNLNSVEADDLALNHIHNLVNYMPESENKKELVNYLCDLLDLSKLERQEFKLLWIRSRAYWMEYLESGFFPSLDGLKGASKYGNYLKASTDITDSYLLTDAQCDIPEDLTDCIDSLLDYCDEENVNVLFVSVPRAERSEAALERINTVSEMIQTRGYDVLYLTDKAEEVGLDLTQDYFDGQHTNIHGSIKFTNYLSEYLLENYGMENKHGNELYGSWDDAWAAYAEGITPGILEIELNSSQRNYSLGVPDNLRAEAGKNGGIDVRWDAVENADGYIMYRKDGYTGTWKAASRLLTETCFSDTDCTDGTTYYYKVVPVHITDDQMYYGNFSYRGINITL